ncbi:quinone oxidoreductase [Simiduia sp. 21SJ11W-1]|uniref:quinone oxidoreductase family protein n=1 Tax=Simiduia sp. 21SJ11W-1 TaxID=2909669 RepID=UPI0020A1FAF8|nr:quinone oxidoreductase [Simiduia sp. 21SJ11W-1]UTA49607.1 quinone oxidoreductase [Simiduia sp. 21SJ11W-1]
MQNRRIQFEKNGSHEVLQLVSSPLPTPTRGQVRVRHHAIGVNFIDTYHRSGLYPVPLPSGLGLEAAGVVDAVGEGAGAWQVGDRVCYCSGPLGAYSDYHCVDAERLLSLPDHISYDTAAASLLKGLTAAYLLYETAQLKPGDWVLVHAAAGGVGQLLCCWAKALGLQVIGTIGREEKRTAAQALGCDAVLCYRDEGFVEAAQAISGGVHTVFDGVGKDTFHHSLKLLRRRGLMVSFGNASGPAPAFSPLELAAHGSLFITRPTLADYTQTKQALQGLWEKLTHALSQGWISVNIHERYPLNDASKAHSALAAGTTQGALLLMPAHREESL